LAGLGESALAAFGEADFDVEAALGTGTRGERGTVGAGDGADDGQAEPSDGPVLRAAAGTVL
jgi:hypothetical protein